MTKTHFKPVCSAEKAVYSYFKKHRIMLARAGVSPKPSLLTTSFVLSECSHLIKARPKSSVACSCYRIANFIRWTAMPAKLQYQSF